jgi:hypothetical protein
MDWSETSEVCFGLLMKGKIAAEAVRPDLFMPPYDMAVELYKSGNTSPEYMVAKLGFSPFNSATEAANQVVGNKIDWVVMLERTHLQTVLADHLDRMTKKLRRGEDIEFSQVVEKFNMLEHQQVDGIPMNEVTSEPNPFMPLGWEAIDRHCNGIPKVGLNIVGGAPASGKTTFAVKLIESFLKTYPEKIVNMFTLEMPASEFKARAETISNLPLELEKRFFLHDEVMGVEELANKASKYKDKSGMVVIDFADLLIKDETSEPEMGNIYKTCAVLAKRMMCPVFLLSQLNRQYIGGIPRPSHIRWTGLAEAMGWNIFMLYNPNTDFHAKEDEGILPAIDGRGYVLHWKCRGGFREHGKPGAIQLLWDGKDGWSEKAETWFSLNA